MVYCFNHTLQMVTRLNCYCLGYLCEAAQFVYASFFSAVLASFAVYYYGTAEDNLLSLSQVEDVSTNVGLQLLAVY